MSDGNKKRDWKVFESLYYKVLKHYERVLKSDSERSIIAEIKERTIKIIDSTTISLCLSMFDWAKFRTAKGGLKIHTCWDDNLQIPDLVNITPAKTHDRYGIGQLIFPKGTIVIEDRAYFDFTLMLHRIQAENVFVTRIKTNTLYQTVQELDLHEKEDQDILKDEIIVLTSNKAVEIGISEQQLRLVHVYKEDENKIIEIITNNLEWSARTIADLYKKRWDIELFFKAMKQNLQIKTFLGTSENAVKSQIYIALISYLLVELISRTIAKKNKSFCNLVEKIRICLVYYLSLDYICNEIGNGAKKIRSEPKLEFSSDLFSA